METCGGILSKILQMLVSTREGSWADATPACKYPSLAPSSELAYIYAIATYGM